MIGIAIRFATPRMRAYTMPATTRTSQATATEHKYPGRPEVWSGRRAMVFCFTVSICILSAQEPPPGLARKVAHRESETQAERNQYAYRQTVRLQELDSRGGMSGEYREVRDVIFSPTHERTEQMVGAPLLTLKHLILTDEDFQDIREIQPFVLTDDRLFLYET